MDPEGHISSRRVRQAPSDPLSVGILLTPEFTLAAFALFVDTLRLAADEADFSRPIHCRWTVMAESGTPVRASCGAEIVADCALITPGQFDYVVVIGGLLRGVRQVGPSVTAYLQQAAEAGVPLVGIGTGSFVLCRAGLMEGRRVCVSWLHFQEFRAAFPGLEICGDRVFEINGDRITCAGGAGAADLAAALVERHLGSRFAQKPHQVLLLAQTRGNEAVQPHPSVSHEVNDDRVQRALLMMEQTLANPVPIAAIASQLRLSVRQLERRFDTALGERPSQLYRNLRLRYARWLLETTTRSITEIAIDAGFSDCAHFSRQFKALHGTSPSRVRRAASSPGEPGGHAGPRAF